ncbi:MAG TPA: hypothetical protein VGU43_04015 [Thermoplasmata archaeon]|nr:hypothetical protein [Thermoplasmata archaeon]
MASFRASDEQLDREIEVTERIAKLRLRRYISELRSLESDLRELRKERARRRAAARGMIDSGAPTAAAATAEH